MNSLDQDDLVGLNTQFLAAIFPATLLEVKGGQFHFFAIVQPREVFVEELQIDGFDVLEIGFAPFVQRRLLTVDEVVVHRDGHRSEAVDAQLDGQSFGERGLARGGRPGY